MQRKNNVGDVQYLEILAVDAHGAHYYLSLQVDSKLSFFFFFFSDDYVLYIVSFFIYSFIHSFIDSRRIHWRL